MSEDNKKQNAQSQHEISSIMKNISCFLFSLFIFRFAKMKRRKKNKKVERKKNKINFVAKERTGIEPYGGGKRRKYQKEKGEETKKKSSKRDRKKKLKKF